MLDVDIRKCKRRPKVEAGPPTPGNNYFPKMNVEIFQDETYTNFSGAGGREGAP